MKGILEHRVDAKNDSIQHIFFKENQKLMLLCPYITRLVNPTFKTKLKHPANPRYLPNVNLMLAAVFDDEPELNQHWAKLSFLLGSSFIRSWGFFAHHAQDVDRSAGGES